MLARRTLVALAALLVTAGAHAGAQHPGSISGQVVDRSRQPIEGATVAIVELNRAARSDRAGLYLFTNVPAGRYTISVRRLGYAAAATTLTVGTAIATATLTLDDGALRFEPVTVTALRSSGTSAASPLATSVLTGNEIHQEGGVSLAHSIAQLPGVRDVSTGQQVGKPMVRGLFGPRVLVLADGSRLEDYSWSDEDGPSIDARIAQRVEVIRGPASVLYGSEALSGVVNVIPADLSYSPDGSKQPWGKALELYGASNNIELGGALMAEGAQSKYAWRVMGTGRFSQNYQTPTGEMQNSSFWAFNGEGALGIRGDNGTTTIRAAHYGGEFHILEATGPEAGDTEGGPVRQTLDDRLQVTNERVIGNARLETKAQWQRHGLTEVSDDCVPAQGQTTCAKVKDKVAFDLALNTGTVDVLLHQPETKYLTGTVGASGMLQMSSSTGPIFLVPSANGNAVGAFAFEQLTFGMLSITGAARGDSRTLSSDAQPEINRTADDRSWSAVTADGGVVFRPADHLSLVANYGSGWRAPTLFDLYANGPNLAEARFEVGNPALKAERSRNGDIGVRYADDRIRAELTAFRNDVDDFIFMQRTANFQNGLRVFQHTQADARLEGMEASLQARVTDALTLRASHDFVNGTEISQSGGEVPLPLMPPPRTILGAAIDAGRVGAFRRVSVGGNLEINQKQTRLNPDDFPTDGYTLLNLDLSAEHTVRARDVRFDLLARNVLNTTYRDYLSRFKEFANGPGINVIFKASFGAW